MTTQVQNSDSLVEEPRIRKEVVKSPLLITKVYTATFQKEGTLSAEVRQTVETTSFYPSKSVSNDKQDNIFSTTEFGITDTPFVSNEHRVAFIPVPMNSTIESVTAQLAKFPDACIYKMMGNRPILTSDQLRAIEGGITSLETIANRQVVRYPATAEPNLAGKLILDVNGKPQYMSRFFSKTAKEDVDNRVKSLKDAPKDAFYTTAEIEAEIQASGQQVL